ncbi:cytochrome oxidase maturation protein Cbb3 [Aeromonas hydrophila]|nr:cytochrome oxidase maturation protein Cbb3 [Aeromonas hydrophila]
MVYHDPFHCKVCCMNIIFVLIPIAILFVIIAGAVFFWAIRSEQFEDLDRQGSNILFDEEQPAPKHAEHEHKDDGHP